MTRRIHSKISVRQVRTLLVAFVIFSSMALMPLAGGIGSGTATADTSNQNTLTPAEKESLSLTTQASSNDTTYVGSDDGNVYALDADTGNEVWSYDTGNAVRSSPTAVDGTVYVGSQSDSVYALDADTGNLEWEYTTGGDVLGSPTVVGGTVYIGSVDTTMYALDAETGTVDWTFDTDGAIEGAPQVIAGSVYFGSADNNVYAVDASTGDEEWRYTSFGAVRAATTVYDGTVYASSYDNSMYALDASDGTEQWRFGTADSVQAAPTIKDGTVYIGSRDSTFYAVDAGTGNEEWSYTTGNSIYSSATVSDGSVYFGSWDDNFYSLNASDGTEQWSYATQGNAQASPTVYDGIVYGGSNDNTTFALDVTNGSEIWSVETGAGVQSSPTVIPAGSSESEGTRVSLGTLGHHNTWALEAAATDPVTGRVIDENGDPIGGATLTFTNVQTGSVSTAQTASNGNFGIIVVTGRYEIEVSNAGYQTLTEMRDVVEGEDLGEFQLTPQQLDLQFTRYVEPGDSTPYTVEFTDANGTVVDVTANVSINSSDTSIATVDTDAEEIVGSAGVNGTSDITVTYTVDNETYMDTRTVTVATKTVDNLEILPGTWRLSALLEDITIQVILVAIGAGIIATRAASSWAGLGAMELVIIIGWFGGWVPIGIAMLGLFTALFIGLNLAANIDYSVRR